MKKLIFTILFWILVSISSFSLAAAPSFGSVSSSSVDWYESIWWVNRDASLSENIRKVFFPSWWLTWWAIWTQLQTVFVWLLIAFIVRAWVMFVMSANDDTELKKSKMNLTYIIYGTFVLFGAIWILWSVLQVWWVSTTASDVAISTQNKIIWWVLMFLKSFAYYVAIMLVVYYGYKIMQWQEKEDKIKAWRTWIINVILALVAIKVLDYLYLIAQQWSFAWKASSLLTSFWTALGWILWIVVVLALIYAWFLLATSRWEEDKFKKARTTITNVFLVIFVVFLFIVIVFDLIKNFA